MANIKSLTLENFRVFKERTTFNFSPINVLTGTNSSGKSSLFKALLLLQDNGAKNRLEELDFRGPYHNLGNIDKARNHDTDPEKPITFMLEFAPQPGTAPFKRFELGQRNISIAFADLKNVETFSDLMKIPNWKNWMYFLRGVLINRSQDMIRHIQKLTRSGEIQYSSTIRAILHKLLNIAFEHRITVENIEMLFGEANKVILKLQDLEIPVDVALNIPSNIDRAFFADLIKKAWYAKHRAHELIGVKKLHHLTDAKPTPTRGKEQTKKHNQRWKDLIEKNNITDVEELRSAVVSWLEMDIPMSPLVKDLLNIQDDGIIYTFKPVGVNTTERLFLELSYDSQEGKLCNISLSYSERFTGKRKLLYSPLSNGSLHYVGSENGNSYLLAANHRGDYFKTDGEIPVFTSFFDINNLYEYGSHMDIHTPVRKNFSIDKRKLSEKTGITDNDKLEVLQEVMHKKVVSLLGSRLNAYMTEHQSKIKKVNLFKRGDLMKFLAERKEDGSGFKVASLGFLLRDLPLLDNNDRRILNVQTAENSLEDLDHLPELPLTSEEFHKLYEIDVDKVLRGSFLKCLEEGVQGIKHIFKSCGKLFNFGLLEAQRGSTKRIMLHTESSVLSQLLFEFAKNADQKAQDFVKHWIREFEIGHDITINSVKGIANDVVITNKRGHQLDLADLGYGISQLLPILLKIALDEHRSLLIEEPETNLHPKMQSKLADLIIDASYRYQTNFLIETHSEYLIRKLQYWTAKRKITPYESKIYYLYNPERVPEGKPQVQLLNIMKDGELDNEFGEGFFDEADNIAIELFHLKQM
ncbi:MULTISPECIES: AAA family ATPase [Flammeovirga]|uniref:AAA family ATPase n=1 Tax=Flammeovirga agarivorans TaxID=2726742 RepID=A0A7X8XU57_9BACT|nr:MULTISPECIES: AAA family ATPase [Flammeovirga]NLR89929.1 AAA family ATPase [Flammeovirga agarivorans]